MASAHVLPNSAASSHKGHLEAGKKRLEEFCSRALLRRQHLPASRSQLISTNIVNTLKIIRMREMDLYLVEMILLSPFLLGQLHLMKIRHPSQSTGAGSTNGTSATSSSWLSSNDALHGDLEQEPVRDEVSKLYGSSGFFLSWTMVITATSERTVGLLVPTDVITAYQLISLDLLYAKPNIDEKPNRSDLLPERSESVSTQDWLGLPSTSTDTSGVHKDSFLGVEQPIGGGSMDYHSASGINAGGGQIAETISRRLNVGSALWHASEPPSADFHSAFRSCSNLNPFPSSGYGTTFG